ncbi:MAG TPA: DUF4038 domain-containing protein [Thermoclostridium sp.]
MKPWENGVLKVSENRRYLVNGTQPFFWLGDTAWSLFQRLSSDEAELYLQNRKEKGFNVIQAVLINPKDKNGKTSFQEKEDCDVKEIIAEDNAAYWDHVLHIVKMAEENGIYMALLPVWGKIVKEKFLNMGNYAAYADFLTRTFAGCPNIIWILGGDIRGSFEFDLWDALGKKLKELNPERLIGYHPFGRTSSSYWFNDCDWLDFNMFQSGHRRYDQKFLGNWDEAAEKEPWYGEDNWRYVMADYEKKPVRPVIDGEPSYEQIPQGLHDPSEPYWQAHHVRRYAYWSVFSGAFGHTYGHNSIFQFYGTGYAQEFGAKFTWQEALLHKGSSQMKILKDLALEIEYFRCMPRQELIVNNGEKEYRNVAFGNEKNIVVYSYTGGTFALGNGPDVEYKAYWIDPCDGVKNYFGLVNLSEKNALTPPGKENEHNDWILLLKA